MQRVCSTSPTSILAHLLWTLTVCWLQPITAHAARP
jgi:hypothetical protein